MIGGICTSVILELLVYPAIYAVWRERSLDHELSHDPILVSTRIDVPNPSARMQRGNSVELHHRTAA